MRKNFDLAKWFNLRTQLGQLRLGAVALLLLNFVAGYFLARPIGGSPEDLRDELSSLRNQMRQSQFAEQRTESMAGKVGTGRTQGTQFLDTYFLERRSAYRTILSELVDAAKEAGIQPKESSFTIDSVQGSDTLEFMKITSNYQGAYADLIHFVNRLDKSTRLLIIEGLQATPQQQGQQLTISLKLDAFVRNDTNTAEMSGTQ
jgi:hypothetical protein